MLDAQHLAAPAAAPDHAGDADGRTARRDRNRDAVLDAVLELFAEGDLTPSAEQVAARSGVSLRSVYRYVADRADLMRAAIDRHIARVEPLFVIDHVGEGTFDERVERFVTARMRGYEAIAATSRASRFRAPTNDMIRAGGCRRAHPDRDDRPLPRAPPSFQPRDPRAAGRGVARAAPAGRGRGSLMATVRREIRIARTADDVWKLVGDPAALAGWFPGIVDAQVDGTTRTITTASGIPMPEEIVTNDAIQRRFQYRITAPIVRAHLGTIDVFDLGDGSALVSYATDCEPDALALIIGGACGNALHELRRRLEDEPDAED